MLFNDFKTCRQYTIGHECKRKLFCSDFSKSIDKKLRFFARYYFQDELKVFF